MELLQLRYFCDAAETENFSKTAQNFFVPPSSISQTIKRLESELETPLFERRANKVKLNEAGLFFYKNAKAALELLENAENSIKKPEKKEAIRINTHICRRIVMEAIKDFSKIYQEVTFITTHSNDQLSDAFDIIVTDKELALPYSKTKAAEEKFLWAYNKNTFSIHDGMSSAEFKDLPFITMGDGSSMYESTLKICNWLGFSPNIVLQSEDPFYARKCVELGLGVTIFPEISWRGQFSEDIIIKSVGKITRNVYVYKKHSMNELMNQFHDILVNKFSS